MMGLLVHRLHPEWQNVPISQGDKDIAVVVVIYLSVVAVILSGLILLAFLERRNK